MNEINKEKNDKYMDNVLSNYYSYISYSGCDIFMQEV